MLRLVVVLVLSVVVDLEFLVGSMTIGPLFCDDNNLRRLLLLLLLISPTVAVACPILGLVTAPGAKADVVTAIVARQQT